jgi:galactokinase
MKSELLKIYADRFGSATVPIIVRSPGRVNIIGEHTDYNDGFVLPAAIDKAAYLAISVRDDDEIHLWADDLQEDCTINLQEIKPAGKNNWPNYILGVVAQFHKKEIALKGFNAVLKSDVPIGAGVSSSAAIECATAFALNELFQAGLHRRELILMAQKAEHEYAGVMCGIMDQFASLMGKKDKVIKLDCRSLAYDYVPFKLGGIKILLLNTNVKHSLASSEYNTRRKECEEGVKWIRDQLPEVYSLRDVSRPMLEQFVLPKNELVYRRCLFVVEEIERLLKGCEDLEQGNIDSLGQKMLATHAGLSKQYEVSCKELNFLVDQVKGDPGVLGARMMGGGFGGCTINLVKEEAIERLIAMIKDSYEEEMGLPLTYYVASIEDGTGVV